MAQRVCIIGGGIVGLSTAYILSQNHPEIDITLLEKEKGLAAHQTGNNSGVIHSGIYYKPGSLKSVNCQRGYKMLLDFCVKHEIDHDICGKIIVATSNDELEKLDAIYRRGVENGLDGLRLLNEKEIREFEPNITGLKAIHVPQAGIVNYKQVAQKLSEEILRKGADIQPSFKVNRLEQKASGWQVGSMDGRKISADIVVNCGGLYCDKIAKMAGEKLDVKIIPFRGEYYELNEESKSMINNLVYPVPDPSFPFLGVHFTRMIEGGVEAGPNAVLAFRREGYSKLAIHLGELVETLTWPGFWIIVSKYWRTGFGEMYRSFSKRAFTKALSKLMPGIRTKHLKSGGAGVRAQACDRKGNLLDDFYILERKGIIHVLNAPSPAATSGLSIGTDIAELIEKQVSAQMLN